MRSSTPRSASIATAVALLVIVATVAVGPAAADARLTLTDATVSPPTPTVGAPITVTTTVRLSGGSDTPVTLTEVIVENADGDTLGRASGLGRLSPGETLSVPVTFTLDEPGAHDIRVVATGENDDGREVDAARPLTVGVERGEPLVELRTDGLVAGANTPVQAVVSNPTTAPLRDVVVRVTEPGRGERLRRTVPILAAGATVTLNFSVRPRRGAATEETNLTVRAAYTEPTGTAATATFTRRVAVEALRDDVTVRVGRTQSDDGSQLPAGLSGIVGTDDALNGGGSEQSGTPTEVAVTVANSGNAPVEDVVVAAEAPDGTRLDAVGRFPVGRLAPGESTTVRADLTGVADVSAVRFVAAYDLTGERRRSVVAYRELRTAGNATLTGVDVTVDGDRVTVAGNLANTGDRAIRGAVVSVQPTEYVTPAYPRRTYFVGEVGGSEFAPFNLTARADVANATAVTVSVTYVAAGDRVAETVAVPLPTDDTTSGQTGALPGIVPLLIGGVVVGIAVPLAVYRRRR